MRVRSKLTEFIPPAGGGIGGSGYENLYQQRQRVQQKLYELKEALADMTPHPRDYMGRTDTYREALRHHEKWLQALRNLEKELGEDLFALNRAFGR